MLILLNDKTLDFNSPHGKTIAVIHSDIMPRPDTLIVFKDKNGNFLETRIESIMINYAADCVVCFVGPRWSHQGITNLKYPL